MVSKLINKNLISNVGIVALLAALLLTTGINWASGQTSPPPIEWIRQFGTSETDLVYAADADGNVYIAGQTYGTLPGQTSAGGADVFVRKYDASGNVAWTRQFGSPAGDESAYGISADASGIYVVGYIGVGGALPGQTSAGNVDAFIRKYNADGTEVWTRQFGTSGSDATYGVSADASGIYVAGWTSGVFPGQTSIGSYDVFVRKYNADGTEVWTRQFGSSQIDFAIGIFADASGVYAAGRTYGTLPGQTSAGDVDAFIRKYNADGTEVWTRQFGSSGGDNPYGVSADASGVYVVGETGGTLPGQTSAGDSDVFVRKYDVGGNVAWTRQFGILGTDYANGVSVYSSDVYVAGRTTGTLPGQTSAGGADVFVRKYNADGTEVWTSQFGGSGSDGAYGVSADASGIYVAGYTDGTLTLAGQTSAGGTTDAFVAKFAPPTPPPAPDTTPPAAVTNLALSNPSTSSINLSWTAPGDDGNTGTAATYDIRYSTSLITEANFSSANQVTGEPAPQVAGTFQSMTVTGLSANASYYFAMKTSDEVPNTSALSNVPSLSTAPPPPSSEGVIYVTNSGSDTVSVINGATNAVLATIPVSDYPVGIAINAATNRIYVTHAFAGVNFGNTVSVIDGSTNTVIATVVVGSSPFGIAVNPNTNRIYVANNAGNTVSVIDGSTNTVIATVAMTGNPGKVGVNPTTNKIYVTRGSLNSVSVIDGATNAVVATIPVGGTPMGVGVNTSTNRLYIPNNSSANVSVIDGATDTVVATVPVSLGPRGVDVNSTTNRAYIANGISNNISVIDGSTNTVIATVLVGTAPRDVGINVATNRAYVPNEGNATVSVIDTTTNVVAATTFVGSGPFGVAVMPPPPVDTQAPSAALISPQDNGPGDLDPALKSVTITSAVPSFVVALSDTGGSGIKDSTVTAATVSLKKNSILLTQGVDYTFSYNATSDQITLSGAAGNFGIGDYKIAVSEPGLAIITDNAGNAIVDPVFSVKIIVVLPYSDNFESYTVDQPPPEPWAIEGGNVALVKQLTTASPLSGNVLALTPLYSSLSFGLNWHFTGGYTAPKVAITLLNTDNLSDVSVKADIARNQGQSMGVVGATLRYDPATKTGYMAGVRRYADYEAYHLVIAKIVNGVPSVLAVSPGITFTPGPIEFKMTGGKLELLGFGQYLSYTDPTPLPAGKSGLAVADGYWQYATLTASFDNVSFKENVPTLISEPKTTATLPFSDNFDMTETVTVQSQLTVTRVKPSASWSVLDPYLSAGVKVDLNSWNVSTLNSGPLTGNVLALTPLYSSLSFDLNWDLTGYYVPKVAIALLSTNNLSDVSVKADIARSQVQSMGVVGPTLRYDPATKTGYFGGVRRYTNYEAYTLAIYKVTNGAISKLAESPNISFVPGPIEFKMTGGKLELFGFDQYLSYTDPSPLPPGKSGLAVVVDEYWQATFTASFDNVSVSSIVVVDADNDGIYDKQADGVTDFDTQIGIPSSNAVFGNAQLSKDNTNPGLVLWQVPDSNKVAAKALSVGGTVTLTCPNEDPLALPLTLGDTVYAECGSALAYVIAGDGVTALYKGNTYDMPNASVVKFTKTSVINQGVTTIIVNGSVSIPPSSSPYTFSLWSTKTSGTTQRLFDVDFVSETLGYAIGENSTILKTTDGGNTWVAQSSPISEHFWSVDFVDANVGYIAGFGGKILKTTNGGATWVQQTSGTGNPLYRVHFPFNTGTGYIVGNGGTLLKTTDGGATWVPQSTPYGNAVAFQSISFPDSANPNVGYVGGSHSTSDIDILLKTADGGATWTALTPNIPGWSGVETMQFVNTQVGFAGGITWDPPTAVDGTGFISKTTDGGATWTHKLLAVWDWPEDIELVNADIVYVTGKHYADANDSVGSKLMLKTYNGGSTWSYEILPTSAALGGIEFPTANVSYAVGNDGVVLKYSGPPVSDTDNDGVNNLKMDGVSAFDTQIGTASNKGVEGLITLEKFQSDGVTPNTNPGLAIADSEGANRAIAKALTVGGKIKQSCQQSGGPLVVEYVLTAGDEIVLECNSGDVSVTETGVDGEVKAFYPDGEVVKASIALPRGSSLKTAKSVINGVSVPTITNTGFKDIPFTFVNVTRILVPGATYVLAIDTTPPSTPKLLLPTKQMPYQIIYVNSTTLPKTGTITKSIPSNISNPTLKWGAVTDADNNGVPTTGLIYDFQISMSKNLDDPNVVKERDVRGLIVSEYTPAPLLDGVYYARVRAKDAAGNFGAWSLAGKFVIDTKLPTVNFTKFLSPTKSLAFDTEVGDLNPGDEGSLEIIVTASPVLNTFRCPSLGLSPTDPTKLMFSNFVLNENFVDSAGVALGDGNYNFTAKHTDAAGNIGSSAALIVKLDRVAPTLSIINPQGVVSGIITTQAQVSDERSGVSSVTAKITETATAALYLDLALTETNVGSGLYEANFDASTLPNPDSSKTFTVTALDKASNSAVVSSKFLIASVALRPIAGAPITGERSGTINGANTTTKTTFTTSSSGSMGMNSPVQPSIAGGNLNQQLGRLAGRASPIALYESVYRMEFVNPQNLALDLSANNSISLSATADAYASTYGSGSYTLLKGFESDPVWADSNAQSVVEAGMVKATALLSSIADRLNYALVKKPNVRVYVSTLKREATTNKVNRVPEVGAKVKVYDLNQLQTTLCLDGKTYNASSNPADIGANCENLVKHVGYAIQSEQPNKLAYGQTDFALTPREYYFLSVTNDGFIGGRPATVALSDSPAVPKDVNIQYIQTSNAKTGAKQTTFTGSRFDLYSPERINIPAGVTVGVPWVGETSDLSWTWGQSFGSVPAGCTVSPANQSTSLSSDGTLQMVALNFDITCSATTTISFLDKIRGLLLPSATAQSSHSRKEFGVSHRLTDNTASGKGRAHQLDERLPARVFETPAGDKAQGNPFQ